MTAEEVLAYRVDKSTWERGPWDNEPDRVDFIHAGLPCLALRHPEHGSWCGYAAVPPGHPLYEKSAFNIDLDVDARLNYSDFCGGAICHIPQPGAPDNVWWFGFDCGHFRDISPGRDARLRSIPGGEALLLLEREPGIFRAVYRDLSYVRHVIEELAEALAAAA